jgi:hypothetical protein
MRALTLLSVCFLFLLPVWADEGHHHEVSEQEVGSVHFATSCDEQEQAFNRAVALLHSFQYEQTRQAFEQIRGRDPNCAMASWGIAMSHYHGLWDSGDITSGRAALRQAQQVAASNPRTTPREKAYIEALAEIYREDDKDKYAHAKSFEQKLGQLQADYPDDSEAAIFHALSLAITAPKTDKTFANQRKCGEILEPIFQKQPHHPGVAHYIIHCYDNPVLANAGLNAARMYAQIAPASAHANHMPSHIFTRVGSWNESIASNRRSEALAAQAEADSQNGEARDQRLHAMDYLEYAYLQTGQLQLARAVWDKMNSFSPVSGITLTGDYAHAAIPARYVMELSKWSDAAKLPPPSEGVPWTQAITWMAIGIGNARSGNLARASEAEQKVAALRDVIAQQNNSYWSNQVEVQRLEVAGWIAQASGKSADARSTLRSAAELEEGMDKHAVTPGAVIPAREMLADLLLLDKHPQESLAEYEATLKLTPNRFNALYGAANAADAAGQPGMAAQYFRKLTEVATGDERSELRTARKKLAARPSAAGLQSSSAKP